MNSGRLPRAQFYIGHFNRGSAYRRAGDFQKAFDDFQEVIALRPGFARGYHARGLAYEDLGQRERALADFNRAIKLNKSGWTAYFSRAMLLRADEDYDGALKDLKTARRLKPDATQVGLLRALVLADKGAITVARAEINKIIADGHGNASSYYARAAVAFEEDRLDAAEDDLDKVFKLKPAYGAAHLLMGRILEARGDTAGAKVSYEKALAAPVHFLQGWQAHRPARERLDALQARGKSAKTDTPAKRTTAAKPAKRDKSVAMGKEEMGKGECRLYLPTTGVTISAPCNE